MKKTEKLEKNKELNPLYYMLLIFFIYAFIGWILETCYALYYAGHFVKRGFLFGPICPIYGYGAVIMVNYLKKYKNNSIKLFIFSAIVFSILEYVAGFALDALFAEKWWDYTGEFLNLNGRISIFYSFVWGIIAILFVNHIHPFVEKYLKKILSKIPYYVQIIVLYILTSAYIIDTVFSIIKYLT